MMKDKEPLPIASNPSNAEYPALLNLARVYRKAYGVMKMVGLTSKKLDDIAAAADHALEFQSILTLPDRFNAVFAERGWIATSSLGVDVMEQALRLAADGDLSAAEEALAAWFDEEKLRIFAILRSRRFHRVPEREEQLEEAIHLYHEGRYWSALPLILIAADGFASDVAGYSAFKEGADLSAFDSIVGHSTSLPNLIRAVTRTRRKSTAEPIALPYRHGILHGQDLGYADRVTCAKGWMLFLALVDWAIDKQSETERRKADERAPQLHVAKSY